MTTATIARASIVEAREFFATGDADRDSARQFHAEWRELSESERSELLEGIGNGSLTY